MKKNRIHKISRTIAASAIMLTLVLSGPSYTVANADTLSSLRDQYAALQSQQQQLQTELNALNSKVSTAKEKRNAINQNVKVLRSQISLLNTQIDTLNSQVKTTNENIAKTEKDIENNTEQYKERVCTLYEVGTSSKLEVLLSSKSISDFLMKFETLKVVSEHDNKLINDLKNDRVKLENDKKSLQSQLAALEESKGSVAAKKQVVDAQLAKAQNVVDGLQDDADEIASERNAVKQKARQTDAEIDKEIARIAEERRKKLAAENGSSSVTNSYLISYARGFLGTKYVFGCANPSIGFDCSGLVQYVFANTKGINLPHKASDMYQRGTPVSRENLQPGDVVFFKISHSYVDHCGIYSGNGNFIAANNGGVQEGVLFNTYWSKYYVGARRMG